MPEPSVPPPSILPTLQEHLYRKPERLERYTLSSLRRELGDSE